jgi:hypothetical protein
MGLTFLNPSFLFGLAAGVLPILIHRLTQRRAVSRKFSAVRLILQSQRIVARPQRLKHLILLVLRVLAILCLVIIMARPVLTRKGILALGEGGAKVVMLDNSMSMNFKEEKESRYDIARKAAQQIIEALKGDVLLLTTASKNRAGEEEEPRWLKPEEALRELASVAATFGQGNPAPGMNLAYRRLKETTGDKEFLVISDMARGDWERFDLSKLDTVAGEAAVTFLRIGGATRDPNFAVKEMRLSEGEAVVGAPCRLEVSVSNYSDRSGSVVVQLFLSGVKTDQKSVDIRAGEEGKVYFELFLDKPGWINGEARLSGDSLPADDVFYFPIKVREKVKVLVVDGDPRTSLRSSESYYLSHALSPGGREGSPFLVRVITEAELGAIDLNSFEALFLLNVVRPHAPRLSSFVESGKPAFIFFGDRIAPEEYNSIPLFPWRIRQVKESGGSTSPRISEVDEKHNVLRLLATSQGGAGLKGASFQRYIKVEGTTRNLLTLDNRDPLLAEAALGKGKLFLYASSADTDWNDLPLKTAYLPLLQGLLKEAVGLAGASAARGFRFGEPFEEKARPGQVAGTQGATGIYRFSASTGEVRHGVNSPIDESDLSKVTEQEIQKKFGAKNVRVVEYRGEAAGPLHAGRKELWPYVLAFLLAVLGAEMVLANKL